MISDYRTEAKTIVAMINFPDALDDGMARLTMEHFQDRTHKELFLIISKLYQANKPVSAVTVAPDALKISGFELKKIMDTVMVNKGEFNFLVDRLEDMRQGRIVFGLCETANTRLDNEPTNEVVDSLTESLYGVGLQIKQDEVISGQELALRALAHIDNRAKKGQSGAVYTQWPKLNRMVGGFEPGDLVIISAPTGAGKSAFTQNILSSLSVIQTIPSLYVNSEMSEEQMSLRWAAMLTKNPELTHSKLRAGDLKEKDYKEITDAMDRLYNSKFACVTIPDLSIDRVSGVIRRYQKRNNVKAVAVDYIGRMDTMNAKLREDQVLLNAAKKLKTLAQQCKVIMFMVAQVKKDGSLQSASYMENEADLHLRIEPMGDAETEKMVAQLLPWNYRVHISKGRNCQKGWMFFRFVGEKLTFLGEE